MRKDHLPMNIEEALSVIQEYELSIERSGESSRIAGWPITSYGQDIRPGNIRGIPEGEREKARCIDYAEKCVDYLRYGYEVDACLAGLMPRYGDVMVRKSTPDVLQELGCSDLPMLKTQRHLKDEVHAKAGHVPAWHGLEVGKVKELAELLEEPCIVMDSLSERGGIVVLVDMLDADGTPVIAPFIPDGMGNYQSQGIASNFIVSLYGKDGIVSYVTRAQKADKLLYVDREKTKSLMSCAGLQLPGACMRLDGIIHQSEEVGKTRPRRQPDRQKQNGGRYPMPKTHAPRDRQAHSVKESVQAARKSAKHERNRQPRSRTAQGAKPRKAGS